MDEATAWLHQARADRRAAELLISDHRRGGACHAVAKWQQTVEKAIKGMVAARGDAGVLGARPGRAHAVQRFVSVLVRLPRSPDNRAIQQQLHGLLNQDTRAGIGALDALAPRLPPRQNTEYPFPDVGGGWTYPAAQGVFPEAEIERFRALAHRILDRAGRIISAALRGPK